MEEENPPKHPMPRASTGFLRAQVSLRICAVAAGSVAAALMFTSRQTSLVYGVAMNAKYSYSPAFRFLAVANVCASFITALALIVVFLYHRLALHFFLMFLHDLVLACLVLGASSSATAIGYVGQRGNSHVGWMPICGDFEKFCYRVELSIAFSYFTFLLFFVLILMSAKKATQLPQPHQ